MESILTSFPLVSSRARHTMATMFAKVQWWHWRYWLKAFSQGEETL